MKVFVIRHGETNMGKNNLIATDKEPLNEIGISQAINVGKTLRKFHIDRIYCSPIERAKHTLELFNLDKNIPIVIDNRIKERNMGIYERIEFSKLDWDVFWGYDSEEKYKEVESMKSVYQRVSNFLNELKEKHGNESVLLVTHGGVIRTIDWYFKGITNQTFQCENCKIYEYELENSYDI